VLCKGGVTTQEDLAEQATDDLLELEGVDLDEDTAAALIMAARAPWFEDAPAEDAEDGAPGPEGDPETASA
jgi:N utilization substance protein A